MFIGWLGIAALASADDDAPGSTVRGVLDAHGLEAWRRIEAPVEPDWVFEVPQWIDRSEDDAGCRRVERPMVRFPLAEATEHRVVYAPRHRPVVHPRSDQLVEHPCLPNTVMDPARMPQGDQLPLGTHDRIRCRERLGIQIRMQAEGHRGDWTLDLVQSDVPMDCSAPCDSDPDADRRQAVADRLDVRRGRYWDAAGPVVWLYPTRRRCRRDQRRRARSE